MEASSPESVHRIERELAVLLRRVRRVTMENARLLHPELRPAAYSVFRFVVDHEPTRACDIVEKLCIDKSAVSRSVAELEDIGLVERRCDPTDHRAQQLMLTPTGRARIATLLEQRRGEFGSRLATWPAQDLAELAGRLHRYNASLEA